jgi:hypothetical protein
MKTIPRSKNYTKTTTKCRSRLFIFETVGAGKSRSPK